MKTYIKIITIVLVGIIGISTYYVKIIKEDFKAKANDVDIVRQGGRMNTTDWLTNRFGAYNFNLHSQLETMVPAEWKNRKAPPFLKRFFRDSLNNSGDILQYIPLFNRKNNKKEAFLLISAGIDGKLNVNYTVGDTIYEDEYPERFDFYNLKEYQENENMKFNLWDYFFGKKDYLVKHWNCIEDLGAVPLTLEHYNYKMHPPVHRWPLSIIAAFEKDSISENKNTIVLKSWMDGYEAFCKMHNPTNRKFRVGDTIMISGYLDKIDENRNFHLTHCVFFPNKFNSKTSEMMSLSRLRGRQLENREKILSNR